MWVDTSYAIHHDIKGHSGGVMSMGKRIVHGKSSNRRYILRDLMKIN